MSVCRVLNYEQESSGTEQPVLGNYYIRQNNDPKKKEKYENRKHGGKKKTKKKRKRKERRDTPTSPVAAQETWIENRHA